MIVYGLRDAASVLMGKGHRVARVHRSRGSLLEWAWKLDGELITLRALEDRAERYERLRYRYTDRRPAPRARPRPTDPQLVMGLHR